MKVFIAPYDPQWPDLYAREEKLLRGILGPLVRIDHIGSTAVPGLGAKPKIDILVGVSSAGELDALVKPMQDAGFTYFKVYERWLPYRRMFARLHGHGSIPLVIGDGEPFTEGEPFSTGVHIHIFEKGSYHWTRHVAFRDYLRWNTAKRDEYFALKKLLEEKEFVDGNDYNRHKALFIGEVEKKAMEWYASQ